MGNTAFVLDSTYVHILDNAATTLALHITCGAGTEMRPT